MSGRLYERITAGRFGSERTGGRRRGAREIDIEVASHRASVRTPSIGAARPARIF
ncbi:hypothetical protein KSP35_17585 [Aquihabitans sp. G128]|uniref:hypothetical protein n=1 Tax=Aquihabitans sp. G128 TaxID=2849779 RepID=UPI001C233917|nr:hypothetical protein [Aquihabitans sp. G128]QXC60150.1 hypothetical protein KSP35_17585 [Aquihabitans sp. G128]